MSLKSEYALKKEIKELKKDLARAEIAEMKAKIDIERRTVEFMNQMQDFFGVVDSFFTEDDVRTLGEAKAKWYLFRDVLEEEDSVDAALDAINRTSIATPDDNGQLLMDLWSKGKQQCNTTQ